MSRSRKRNYSPEMKEAMALLESQGIRFIDKTDFQLKIGPINFYPNTGTDPPPARWSALWYGF